MIANHYGFGVRNDEDPFAHKIPPGGDWRDLSEEDQRKFMGGAFLSGGGKTGYLRREAWDQPSSTILAAPMAKATCQLHPGRKEGSSMGNVIPIQKPLLDALPKQPPTGLTSIELFAGGGLMRLGIEWAGIETIWANDFDKNAVRAHTYNFGEGSCTLGDITKIPIDDIPDADIIVGGPPCQDYSVAGKGEGEAGERGKLVWRYLEIIAAKRPKAFLFENVKGLITKRHRPTFDALLRKFDEIGYNVSWRVINAWDYGVAQKRERVFIVGIRKDFGITYEFPPSEYETTGYRPVLRDAIGDLPEPLGTALSDKAIDYLERDPRHLQKHRPPTMEEASPTLPAVLHKGVPYGLFYPNNHETYPLTDAQLEHSKNHQIGYNDSLDKPARIVRAKAENILDIANHGVKDYWTPKSEYTYDQANRVQSMDAPSNTIPAHHNSGQPIHPTQKPRRFTVRECLRIQSVPDTYVFPDDMSLSAMYRVVGNGVASRVAYHLGKALAVQLLGDTALRTTNATEARDAA